MISWNISKGKFKLMLRFIFCCLTWIWELLNDNFFIYFSFCKFFWNRLLNFLLLSFHMLRELTLPSRFLALNSHLIIAVWLICRLKWRFTMSSLCRLCRLWRFWGVCSKSLKYQIFKLIRFLFNFIIAILVVIFFPNCVYFCV